MTTPYAVLLNNDAVPEPDWLRNLLAPFYAPGGERLGATTGKVVFLRRVPALQLVDRRVRSRPARPPRARCPHAAVEVDGDERLGKVLWEQLAYGPEGPARPLFLDPAGG